MIENRMKNAMQQKLPDVPEGFDARSDMQLVRLVDYDNLQFGENYDPKNKN